MSVAVDLICPYLYWFDLDQTSNYGIDMYCEKGQLKVKGGAVFPSRYSNQTNAEDVSPQQLTTCLCFPAQVNSKLLWARREGALPTFGSCTRSGVRRTVLPSNIQNHTCFPTAVRLFNAKAMQCHCFDIDVEAMLFRI